MFFFFDTKNETKQNKQTRIRVDKFNITLSEFLRFVTIDSFVREFYPTYFFHSENWKTFILKKSNQKKISRKRRKFFFKGNSTRFATDYYNCEKVIFIHKSEFFLFLLGFNIKIKRIEIAIR